jgi:hypothetical protein
VSLQPGPLCDGRLLEMRVKQRHRALPIVSTDQHCLYHDGPTNPLAALQRGGCK